MKPSKTLIIHSKFLDYSVQFESEFNFPKKTLCIVDSNVVLFHKFPDEASIVSLQISEESKDLDSITKIIKIFQDHDLKRSSQVIFVGGGVMQDLGTFATSIYMRGIEWIYYPTTLQAMIDSCIGGKSSINYHSTKNVLGNYYPPSEVRISTQFLSTLSTDQIISGLIEGIKIATAGKCLESFIEMLRNYRDSNFQAEDIIVEMIVMSLESKRTFIQEDEFDQGVRKVLNYGHTFGHAIESISNFTLDHGVAVGIGIISANFLSRDLGLIEFDRSLSESAILELFTLLGSDLTFKLDSLNFNRFIHFLRGDKKTTDSNYTFVLPSKSGLVLHEMAFCQESEDLILAAVNAAILEVKNHKILG